MHPTVRKEGMHCIDMANERSLPLAGCVLCGRVWAGMGKTGT